MGLESLLHVVGVCLNVGGTAGRPVLEAAEEGLRAWPKGLLVSGIKLLKEQMPCLISQQIKPNFPVGTCRKKEAGMVLMFLHSHCTA